MTFKLSCGLDPFSALNVFRIALLGFTFKKAPNVFQLSICIYIYTHVCLARNRLEESYLFAFSETAIKMSVFASVCHSYL